MQRRRCVAVVEGEAGDRLGAPARIDDWPVLRLDHALVSTGIGLAGPRPRTDWAATIAWVVA